MRGRAPDHNVEGGVGVKGGFDDQAFVWFEKGVVFFFGAVGVVALCLHAMSQFGPGAVEGGDGLAVDGLPLCEISNTSSSVVFCRPSGRCRRACAWRVRP